MASISRGFFIVHKSLVQIAAQRGPLGNIWLKLVCVIPAVLGLSWVGEWWTPRSALRRSPAGREGSVWQLDRARAGRDGVG